MDFTIPPYKAKKSLVQDESAAASKTRIPSTRIELEEHYSDQNQSSYRDGRKGPIQTFPYDLRKRRNKGKSPEVYPDQHPTTIPGLPASGHTLRLQYSDLNNDDFSQFSFRKLEAIEAATRAPLPKKGTNYTANLAATPHAKRKETLFTLPLVSGPNAVSAVSIGSMAIAFGNISTFATATVGALLSPTDTKAQYIVMAVQAGVAAGTAAISHIPWVQRYTGDLLNGYSARKRWGTPISSQADDNPIKEAVLAGLNQKYKLASKQLSVAACVVGAGVFIGRPWVGWVAVSGSMAGNLAVLTYVGETVQKQIRTDLMTNRQINVYKSAEKGASQTERTEAKELIDKTEKEERKKPRSIEMYSLASFIVFGGSAVVGCLYAAGLVGNSADESRDQKLNALQKHAKVAIPLVIGGLFQLAGLPGEHKMTEIANIKMRAALATRDRTKKEVAQERQADQAAQAKSNWLTKRLW